MTIEPTLSRITIYPVKSLDGMCLQKAMISDGGCLLHDREYAITDESGNFIIGKTNPLVHRLRSAIDFDTEIISFRKQDESTWTHFHLQQDTVLIEVYLSEYFGVPVLFKQKRKGRFLDMPDVSGITFVSTASLQSVSGWFDNMDIEETRRRFRATIEIGGVPPFWEDHLFSNEGNGIEFKIGDVSVFGMSPRARCVVPTRNPETGEVIHGFPKIFSRHRQENQPGWSTLDEYGHHYYLTVNCHIPVTESGKFIEVGDKVIFIGERKF